MKGVCNMPGGDRKGPEGGGPRTGRGLGYCIDNDQPGYGTGQPGRGFGRGFGWRGHGRRWRGHGGYPADNPEIDTLKAKNQELRGLLQLILDKLDKLGN
jgi:hypothetical protein